MSQAANQYLADAASAPTAIWIAYAAACIAGLLGATMLYFNPAGASLAFGLSLVFAVIYFGWTFTTGAVTGEEYGIGAMVMGVTLILMLVSRRFRNI
ncbi:hypothetical protein [Paracoccus albus]|uniref:hypothetical protein n=1 Tax=Paracoccus albus TaxID=3017784 RepID=UPI0022F0FEE7|nr:hypothetical protein [Paracoccus albus]WBU61549.1 hypothetical protein PAF20_06515 [Paracoccus albus]